MDSARTMVRYQVTEEQFLTFNGRATPERYFPHRPT